MSASKDQNHAWRLARQHAMTSRLLGVEVMPIAPRSVTDATPVEHTPPSQAQPAAQPPAQASPDKPKTKPQAPAPSAATTSSKVERLAELRERYERESIVAKNMPGWNKIVFSDGSPDAALMFIGEAPGADEDASGIPFVGRAGQKLTEMITAMHLDRAAEGPRGVYIANILKVRPPNNRTPTPEEAAQDGIFLEEQIRIVQPRVIVTLGKPAANYLLRTSDSMGSLRGIWHNFEGIPVMPTYHPAYLLRAYTPENRRRVWSDLQQAMAKLRELGAINF
ncbi:MAG: uracil-DNA glycosylase [Phycisphaerales bacterium JB065]